MKRLLFLLVITFLSLLRMSGQPTEPILKLNSAFHTAAIRSISTDAQGLYMLTASEDKTARLWDARNGNALRIFRPPIGYGNEGRLLACALSQDGTIAAVGGSTGGAWNKADSFKVSVGNWSGYARELKYSVYLFSTSTGELLLNIDHLEAEVQDLCFSPDGKNIAIALADNKGIRILKTQDGSLVRKIIGYGGSVRKMTFSPSGQFASVAEDQYLRVYDKAFQLLSVLDTEGKPTSVTFSYDELTIAVGNGDKSYINLYKTTDRKTYTDTTLPLPSNSFAVAANFTANGTLFWGESLSNGKNQIVAWKNGKRTEIPSGSGKISGIQNLPDGSVVYSTHFPETGRIMSDFKSSTSWDGKNDKAYRRTADMISLLQPKPELFELNEDGSVVGLLGKDGSVLYFSLADRDLKTERSYLPKPSDNKPSTRITGWRNGRDLFLNNKPLHILEEDEISQCIDISGNGKNILLGTNFHLIYLDAQGKVLWKKTLYEESVAAKISGNGKVAVIALRDGTYAWHDMNDGRRMLNLFVHPDQKRWILWMPDGLYDCAVGAEDLVGWNLNQGKNKASTFYPVAQFRSNFYRPEIIDQSVGIKYNMQYAQLKKEVPKPSEPEVKQTIAQILPPEINILNPKPGSSVSAKKVKIEYTVNSQTNKPVESVKVLIDGRPVQLLPSVKSGKNEIMVDIPEQDCEISLIAKNEHASSVPANIRVKWTGNKEENIFKPKLYVLAVGVSKYKDKSLTLQYAAKDASDFANVMSTQKGLLYSDVSIKLLTDDKSNKINILDGLDWIQNETTSRDVAMIFFAGHGMNDNNGNFYYMPVEGDGERLRATCVNYSEIQQSVASIAGKVVLFMDACHSGGVMGGTGRRSAVVDIVGFVNELASAENGVVVFTSSTGRQYSLEDPEWNNGAFTKALVEGIAGKADLLNQNSITIKTLDLYISQRVKELTKGKQSPTTIVPASISDFPIALKK